MITYKAAMDRLKSYGTAQATKIYIRHGAPADNTFGVSFANLKILAKEIKRDQALARQLWDSGNYDARNLAAKVAEPAQMDYAECERWARDVDNYAHAGFLGELAAQSPDAKRILNAWTAADGEFVRQAGYSAVGTYVRLHADSLSEAEVTRFLDAISDSIHTSPNWARYGMNWALISIGTYKLDMTAAALKVAAAIGTVEVDHGETSCKTPAAGEYIKKAAEHYRQKLAKQAAKRAKR